jgi:hypothetical protein
MKRKVDPTIVPERIFLLLFEGEGGSHIWCDQSDPSGSGDHDAVEYVRADRRDRLARVVLLFHRGGPWSDEDRATWRNLTGEDEATTKVLCDLARRTIEDAER